MVFSIIQSNPLLFHIIVGLTSLIVLAKSADLIVFSISDYAKKLGISDYLIGFIVVSIGTALPELVAGITGAVIGQGSIVFGTVFGSNFCKIPLIGLLLLVGKKIRIKGNAVGVAPIITFMMALLPLILLYDQTLSRLDGAFLVVAFLLYILKLWHGEGQMGKMQKSIPFSKLWKDFVIFGSSLGALLLAGRWLVFSSLQVAQLLSISPYIIGLLVIGIGASAPELTVQMFSILKHRQGLAFGNILGSVVANSTMVLGIVALIKPISIQFSLLLVTVSFFMLGLLYVLVMLLKKELTWKHGVLMISIYLLFLLVQFTFGSPTNL